MQYLARSAVAAATAMVSSLNYAQPAHIEIPNSDAKKIEKEENQIISRPKTPVEFARNFKYIFDHDSLLQADFYSEDNLKNIFNLRTVKINKAEKSISILADDFFDVFPREKMPEAFEGSIPSASLVIFKANDTSGLINAGLNFGMKTGGPNFQETRQILNKKFELLYAVPSPHSVFSPPTAAHGNEHWRYELIEGDVKKTITVGFNPGGELSNVLIEFKN